MLENRINSERLQLNIVKAETFLEHLGALFVMSFVLEFCNTNFLEEVLGREGA